MPKYVNVVHMHFLCCQGNVLRQNAAVLASDARAKLTWPSRNTNTRSLIRLLADLGFCCEYIAHSFPIPVSSFFKFFPIYYI